MINWNFDNIHEWFDWVWRLWTLSKLLSPVKSWSFNVHPFMILFNQLRIRVKHAAVQFFSSPSPFPPSPTQKRNKQSQTISVCLAIFPFACGHFSMQVLREFQSIRQRDKSQQQQQQQKQRILWAYHYLPRPLRAHVLATS